jgi:hypothetical protein
MSSGRRVVPIGWADGQTDKWTDMTKIIVAFRYFANVPKNRPKIENVVVKEQRHFLTDEVVSKNRKNIC